MISKEYECCFKVKDCKPFIDYCISNGYTKTKECYQVREIFRGDGFIARITTDDENGKITQSLDFKEDKRTGELIIVRKESKEMPITDLEAALSILEFLNLKKDNVVKRNRVVYECGDVKFEIDDYFSGEFVIAIEGESSKVDAIYNVVKEFCN